MAATKPRPYKRIVTSAMHRRFVHASALSLLVCYLISIAIGDKSSFLWTWFPLGWCGIRTLMLAISPLLVFILRVSQLHIGSITTKSSLGTFRYLFPLQIAQTFGCYIFTAWLFTEIYIWSSPASAELEMVKRGRSVETYYHHFSVGDDILTGSRLHERPTLNERPIYIHTYHFLLACTQAVVHLYCDYDRVPVPVAKRAPKADDQRTHPVPQTAKHIQNALPPMLSAGLTRSAVVAGILPVVYPLVFRQTAWGTSLYFAKLFWNFSRSSSQPSTLLLTPSFVPLLIRTIFSGFLLVSLWQTTNVFFSVFIGKEPLKRGQPLTIDAKDPNGSLITGLKTKKEMPKAFAFWELSLISQRQPERRKTIFNEIDREGGSSWSQVVASLTDVIKAIPARISAFSAPPPEQAPQPTLQPLPRLTEALKTDSVFAVTPKTTSRQDKFGQAFGSTARSYGQSPDWTPAARARARHAIDQASTAMLSPERKKKLLDTSKELKMLMNGPPVTYKPENVHPVIASILRTPVGQFFCQPYARRASNIVLDGPSSSLTLIVDAVDALTRLLVASLAEDQYGRVQADVAPVIRLFTETIMAVEEFVHGGGLHAHWTDVSFPPSSNPEAQVKAREIPNVDLVLDTLKSGLRDLLEAFKPYLRDIGVEGKDLRLAKEAAGVDAEEDLS
ncbi:nuclear envelope protein [Penicillium argentinense]|uniref:Nuclear envelope protein n=1 Tax=Penicillium argentinense TaxID=1131581 RepID=A0A9W9KBL5_9EURO|nr:nuclear envelope protein [Penicillium argentinense]KAJ5099077.1 nuclear envelope protein [Penicillium argentinense]